mmetsp:Transcript_61860/g.191675  ORF Transcript_61860/g.191675 Transcript_61860/m.191675 type:complete len:213 (+) Transcript_61860:837-1475(+)
MAASAPAKDVSTPFFLSSAASSCTLQYCLLAASSFCSALRVRTISSIILRTFSKPTCFPPRASSRRPIFGCDGNAPPFAECVAAVRRTDNARARRVAAFVCIWTKLALALGRVFLNMSRLSSSLSTLMTSARAVSSSALVALMSSHSLVLVSQPVSSWERNCPSWASDSFVSSRSPVMPAISTPSSPARFDSSSICPVKTTTSFAFAAARAS